MSVEFIDAIDNNRNVVRATLGYTHSGKKAFCPDENCGQPVFSKHYSISEDDGWSHYPGHRSCNYMHGEMCYWHLKWQILARDSYRYGKEGWKLFKGERIPDIYGFNRVIEIQHSTISLEEIIDRSKFYRSKGYKIDWIFDLTEKKNIPTYIEEYVEKHKMGRVFIDYGISKDGINLIYEKLSGIEYLVTLDNVFNPKRIKYYGIKENMILSNPYQIEEYKFELYKKYEELKKEKQIENFGKLKDGRIWIKY